MNEKVINKSNIDKFSEVLHMMLALVLDERYTKEMMKKSIEESLDLIK